MTSAEPRPELKRSEKERSRASHDVDEQPATVRPQPPEARFAVVEDEVQDVPDVEASGYPGEPANSKDDRGLAREPKTGASDRRRDWGICHARLVQERAVA